VLALVVLLEPLVRAESLPLVERDRPLVVLEHSQGRRPVANGLFEERSEVAAGEQVRMWRAADESRVLLMAGQTTQHAIEPRGEYVFGIVAGQPMRSCRGQERRLVQPGQLLAWDPSQAHAGTAVDGRAWSSRLIVVEVADMSDLAGDPETDLLVDVEFPNPVIADPEVRVLVPPAPIEGSPFGHTTILTLCPRLRVRARVRPGPG
jgi:hypothetical protein